MVQPSIEITQVTRQSSDGNTQKEGVRNVDIKQAKVIFNELPASVEELKSIDRSGENGKYLTMALLFCAFKTWTPEDNNTCNGMLEVLMNSPTCGMTFNNFGKQFLKDRMMQNNKYPYLANAYFDGASVSNGYSPAAPFSVTVEEYVYNIPPSTMYGPKLDLERIIVSFDGADTPRYVDFYVDPKDNQWYAWSDSYKGLLADIKVPAI